jgi:LCP family protein required for cell wall assembly
VSDAVSDDRSPRDPRQVHIPAPGESTTARPAPRAPEPPRTARPAGRTQPAAPLRNSRAAGAARPASAAAPAAGRTGTRRRLLPHRPKLRRLLLLTSVLLPLLLLVTLVGGWLYARSVFDKIERVEVSDVLSHGGEGTNYLVVGSDSRDLGDLEAAGLNPDAFKDGGGERSDTMLLLRLVGGTAQMLSIPRDLFVPIAETGRSAKINSAYNGGPRRLILTVQQALGIPIHHYLEVDFVSFASLVDSLGGITIDFRNPAFDHNSGLDVDASGPVVLDGPQALAFVRSRHYVEVIDGKNHPDLTGDLGRITRQQQFLTAVLGKLGQSKNPISLARTANSASGGLRIDDSLGLFDAARLAWRMRGMHPETVVLPVEVGRNSAGSVVFLVHPDADDTLAGFK